VLAGLVHGSASAAGFYIQEQSVRATGRAYSGEGADTGSNSLWWNPASLGLMAGSGDAYLGFNWVGVNAQVSDTGSTIQRPVPGLPAQSVGGASVIHDPVDTGYIPNLSASWKVGDRFAVGVAVTAPFNFATRYPLDSFNRYQALKSYLVNADIQPTIDWSPNPQLSFGIGFDFDYVRATLSNALPNPSPLLGDGGQTLKGGGWDEGFVVGAQYRPTPGATVGISWRTGVKHHLDGTVEIAGLLGPAAAANVAAPAAASFKTPSILTLSGRFKVMDRLTLDGQVQYSQWSRFDAIRVNAGGRTTVIPQGYQDTASAAVGADYELDPTWTLRAGVQFDPTPTPDNGRTTRVPDSDRTLFAAGATIKPSPHFLIDLAASYIHFSNTGFRSDATAFAGTPLATPISMQGQIDGHALVLAAGARYQF
jgi:long-chain fatty acid transport protein